MKVLFADLRRRKLQSAVIFLVVALSSFAGTLALSLLVETNAPFDHAFQQANGAHLIVNFDPRQVTTAQVAATASLSVVSSSSGPYRDLPVPVNFGSGEQVIQMQGRDRPDTAVDRLQISQGRWLAHGGEIVISNDLAQHGGFSVGSTLTPDAATGIPAMTVVGIATAVADRTDAWVQPAQLPSLIALRVPGKQKSDPGQLTMYYRFHSASTDAQVAAGANAIAHAVPTGAIAGTQSYLDVKRNAAITEAVMIPFLLALGIFALVASALIVANVVTGAIIAGKRELGIMKAVGFTPAQLTGVLLGQVLIPAIIGCAIGMPLGVLASQPLISDASHAFGLPVTFAIAAQVDAAWLAVVLAIVVIAALIPSIRAGRIPAAQVISDAVSPRRDGSAVANSVFARLPFGRPVTLGGALMFARPLRSGMTLVAVLLGVASVTFALGLQHSLSMVAAGILRTDSVQVQVQRNGDTSDATVAAAIQHQPGTARFVAERQIQVSVAGMGQPVDLYATRGDSAWLGYPLIQGRWYSGPDEAVAPTAMLTAANLHVGDTALVTGGGSTIDVRIVGMILDQTDTNILLRTDWSTLTQLDPTAEAEFYEVQLTPGTNAQSYARALNNSAPSALFADTTNRSGADNAFFLIDAVLTALALVLAAIAAAGVFNTVLLTTREKARDTAILKAVGMSPRQTILVVLSSVLLVGAVGGLLGIPSGIALHREILSTMAQIASRTLLPASFYAVFTVPLLAAMLLAGVTLALIGAYLPARWAARSRVAEVLHAE